MTALVVRGDALRLPIADNSVDLVICSPPYFALRSYQTGHEMEVGSEATPQAYLEALWAATAEMARVLKPTGSIFVNLGDKYGGASWETKHGQGNRQITQSGGLAAGKPYIPDRESRPPNRALPGTREKSLIGLPWRYAIGCIDHLSLILRAELVWAKVNSLPESVTDRVRRSHETWFHFVTAPRYFAALDELREPYRAKAQRRFSPAIRSKPGATPPGNAPQSGYAPIWEEPRQGDNPLGALPGSVWSIPSEPLRLPPRAKTNHYAAFPSEWPRRLILGFTPHVICGVCGVGRFPIVDRYLEFVQKTFTSSRKAAGYGPESEHHIPGRSSATIVGYGCGCTPYTDHPGTGERQIDYDVAMTDHGTYANTAMGLGHAGLGARPKVGPWREYHLDRWTPPPGHPATVCDPFGGTGTVAHVAHALGRHAITIDLSEPYCRLAADTSLGSLARQRAAKVQGRVHAERQGSLL